MLWRTVEVGVREVGLALACEIPWLAIKGQLPPL